MKKLLIALFTLYPSLGYSHGSDKPGPHGGFVQMPGVFHTEVVAEKDGSFRVYLLDINIQNPIVKDSSVDAWFEVREKKRDLKCEVVQPDHFKCKPEAVTERGKELIIKAKRESAQGSEAKYKLPLSRH